MAKDWSYFGQITKKAADILAKNDLLISRRSGWGVGSESQAARLGVTLQEGQMNRWFVTAGETIRPKYEHGPLVVDGGELADDDYIRQKWNEQGRYSI